MKLSKKQVQLVSGSIVSSYINLHYLEECMKLGVFKRTAKLNVRKTLTDLISIEDTFFDAIEGVDTENLSDKLVGNNIQFIDEFLSFDFSDFTKLQEVFVAFKVDREGLCDRSDSILSKEKLKNV